ncbi:MAG: manganese efflux pump [Clostridia bacterium]|nr:manganese efflux pump [Clostridia bacterium]
MDAFSVAICKGLCMPKINPRQTALIGLFFGGFQALMPLLGWLLGSSFASYVNFLAPWVSFVLLGFIGGKMIVEALHEDEPTDDHCDLFSIKELFILAIATSIDALAMGVSFSLDGTNIWLAIAIIGITTLILSMIGVAVGHHFGTKYKKRAELAGGIILCIIGIKILLEHLL